MRDVQNVGFEVAQTWVASLALGKSASIFPSLDNISKMHVTNLHMVTKTVDATTKAVKDASRTIGRLSSDVQKIGSLLGADHDLPDLPDVPKAVEEVQHVFGSALEQVQKAISFLENLKFLPHFKVSMTNEWGMIISTSMNRDDLLAKVESPTREAVGRIIESFDFLISAIMSLSAFPLKMHIGTTIKIPTGVRPHCHPRLRLAHLQLRLMQQQLRSKGGNGKCTCRHSDVELPVTLY